MKKKAAGEPILHVKIISPTQTYYDGRAVSVSAINKVGPFDILGNHANFFSLLTAGTVAVNTGWQKLKFPISQGIVKVSSNMVTLFVDIEPAYMADDTPVSEAPVLQKKK